MKSNKYLTLLLTNQKQSINQNNSSKDDESGVVDDSDDDRGHHHCQENHSSQPALLARVPQDPLLSLYNHTLYITLTYISSIDSAIYSLFVG